MVPAPPSPSASPFSEDGILACLARHFPQTHASLLLGRGDDCAVLKAGRPLCVSSDLFLEDIHFRRSYFSPEDMGHKALAVNVSDLAACGSRPLASPSAWACRTGWTWPGWKLFQRHGRPGRTAAHGPGGGISPVAGNCTSA